MKIIHFYLLLVGAAGSLDEGILFYLNSRHLTYLTANFGWLFQIFNLYTVPLFTVYLMVEAYFTARIYRYLRQKLSRLGGCQD